MAPYEVCFEACPKEIFRTCLDIYFGVVTLKKRYEREIWAEFRGGSRLYKNVEKDGGRAVAVAYYVNYP